ncbi:RNaseH domain-containing protein [Anabaena sp. CCY 9402-a]|uniref:RNaseH domain-containing protein n=1 Tax=Anabaena sp. CCY 9402-a TaxID=3103867 RepID=UPI0039C69A88
MMNNFDNEIKFEEDLLAEEEDEETEGDFVSDTLYIQPGAIKPIAKFPLAFTVPDKLRPIIVEGYTLTWTKPALQCFGEIQKGANVKNVPYGSLRNFLQVVLKDAARIEPEVGLSKYALNYAKGDKLPEPFVYFTGGNEEKINRMLRPIINDWLTNYLKPFAEKEDISIEIINRLEDLQEKVDLIKVSPFKSQVLPWTWDKETDTTQPKDKYAYRMLADYVARQIAGKVIFPELGAMKRVIFSNGTFTSGIAELITDPIPLDGTKGKFSFVVSLEVVTYPSLHQPLLKVEISKRRWLTQLKPPKYDRRNISGFIFSQEHTDRAFSYQVKAERDKNSKNGKNSKEEKIKWVWRTDKDFEILRRELNLGSSCDGKEIARGLASTNSCEVLLTYRNGLQDNSEDDEETSEKYGIETGVPEIDKLDAFEAIAKILQPLGIEIFDGYIKIPSKHNLDDTASRMINLPTLLGGVLEALETNTKLEFTPKYLDQLNDKQIDDLLSKYFDIRLESIHWGRKALQFSQRANNQTNDLQAIIQANQAAMQRLYPYERPSMFIFYEAHLQTEAKLLQKVTQLLWCDTLDIKINRLPENTHGPKEILPGKELKAKERSQKRIEAWESTAKQIAKLNQPIFCLIMAREFYPDPNNQKSVKHDDKVNKTSTRKALAIAGAAVQFLLPIEKTRKANHLKLVDFFHRMQSALKDLIFAHSGRIDDVKEKVDKYLQNIPQEARPKEIIAITIERKQQGRARGKIEDTFLPIAIRLNVDTGKCEFRCAYKKGNLVISPWISFSAARAFVAELTPIKLVDKIDKDESRKIRFMDFVKQVVSDSVEEGKQPLIMIDSSNCVQLWSWLADIRINANRINLGSYQDMQVNWQGARIIRIRQEIAPGIIEKKSRHLIETSLEDTRTKEELKKLPPALEIPSASSATGLFRLSATNQTGCVAYLSVARELPHQYTRGQSCYRSTYSLDKKTRLLTKQAPFAGRWPTPNPLEIVVTLRQPEDNPDDLAAFVESLRYGFGHYSDWTALPAPLFFERVVRDYISDFTIEDDESEGDEADS